MKAGVPLPDITAQYPEGARGAPSFLLFPDHFVYRQAYIPHGYAPSCLSGSWRLRIAASAPRVSSHAGYFSAWVPSATAIEML